MKRCLPLLLASLAGCSSADPVPAIHNDAERTVGRTRAWTLPAPASDGEGRITIDSVRQTARAQAQLLYGHECGQVVLPDRAFETIDINGDDRPEYAVLFSRANCTRDDSPNRWLGTGGANVQIWNAVGQPRLLLEHSMHAFSPRRWGLLSLQHGGFCPDGTGPNVCLVEYRWNEREHGLEPARRTLYDGSTTGQPPRMSFAAR